MYSISRQETTGLWVVKDDSTGKIISRGDTPLIAINLAIEKGMPSENKEALLIEANYIIKQEEEANAAKSAADTAASKQAANPLTTTADKVTAANNVAAEQLASDQINNPAAEDTLSYQEKAKLDTPVRDGTADLGLLGFNTDQIEKAQQEASLGELGINTDLPTTKKSKGRPNPLDDYANFTYGLSLHVLPPSIYNKLVKEKGYQYVPVTDGGKGTVLIASAGRQGEKFKRDENFIEDFYFENLKFTTIIGLNARTRGTNVIEVHFNIIEPYGITLMNRILAVADSLKAKNWDQLPFMLQIDFYGNSDDGLPLGPITEQTKFIPIKLINCKIKASSKGSEYQFDAVPYAHTAFSESNCTTPAFFEVQAKTIGEFFSSTRSAGDASNIIASRNAADNAVREAKTENDIVNSATEEFGHLGVRSAGTLASDEFGHLGVRSADTLKGATEVAQANKTMAYRTYSYASAMNSYENQLAANNHQQFADAFNFVIDAKIADSIIVEPKRNPANNTTMPNRTKDDKTAAPGAAGATAIRANLSKFNVIPTGIDTSSTTFSINAGTSMVEVINQVIKNSNYFKEQIKSTTVTEVKTDAPLNSFKIIPRLELGEFDEKRRVYQKTITYYIMVSTYHNTKYPKADKSHPSKCVKEYYYMYTGKNQSILDFNIDFDCMFFTIMTADPAKNQSITVQAAGTTESNSTDKSPTTKNASIAENKIKLVPAQADSANTNAATRDDATVAATDLHKSMMSNSRGDMINVKLKISGDPEFIKQDDLFFNPSNSILYQAGDNVIDKHSSLTTDAQQIFALLEFRTPSDLNQETGLMDFTTYSTSVFSGIYQIIQIENSFDKGQFVQSLDLIRLFDQPKYDSNTAKVETDQRKENPSTPAGEEEAKSAEAEAQKMETSTEAKTDKNTETSDKDLAKDEVKKDTMSNTSDVAPDINRQSLQKIDETAPTTPITSTAGDGNVVDMSLG